MDEHAFRPVAEDPRRERILDAAMSLFLRMGYTHTSTNAIAARANVSKATLYTYWPNKVRLFNALVVRESLRVLDEWERAVEADPAGGGIGPLTAHGFRALAANPLLSTLYSRDLAMLDELFRRRGPQVYTDRYRGNLAFVRAMQRAGVIRTDMSAEAANHFMQAISAGVVALGELVDPGELPPLEVVAETIATGIQGALAPATPAPQEAAKRAIRENFAHLRDLMAASLAADLEEQSEQSERTEQPEEHDDGDERGRGVR